MTRYVSLKAPDSRASSLLLHNCRFGPSGNNGEHQPATRSRLSWKRTTIIGRAPKYALYFYSKPPIPTKVLLRLHDSWTYHEHTTLKARMHSRCGGSEPKSRLSQSVSRKYPCHTRRGPRLRTTSTSNSLWYGSNVHLYVESTHN